MNKITFSFIIICVLIYFTSHKIENLNVVDSSQKPDTKKIDFLDDPLFKDVIFYKNDDDPLLDGRKTGLEKCIELCNGRCVEFGITGASFCFPLSK